MSSSYPSHPPHEVVAVEVWRCCCGGIRAYLELFNRIWAQAILHNETGELLVGSAVS